MKLLMMLFFAVLIAGIYFAFSSLTGIEAQADQVIEGHKYTVQLHDGNEASEVLG